MTRIVDNLVRDGCVRRTQDEQDRRVVRVSLTEKGQKVLQDIEQTYHDYHRRIVANIPAAELHRVVESLRLLRDAIRETPIIGQPICAPKR